ncbi:MAG: tRNA (adenosine(37)-N6)-threonylcarbamoyltransferase complex dimerization subunit type 1 TsaB [Candidatus Omnitrophica bacterium]|nr:tRNA (adenosine(37)-N6)-threonylcarbamoyltransferase complex dimerization subunit type 1 TsaB [Candidatus Omnitrophota bacterium]
MHSLIVDTSGQNLCVAVADNEWVICRYNRPQDRQHGRLLIPTIDAVLRKSGYALADIDCCGVNIGPGSFTGLRIGVATLKGLCLASGKPLIGFSSLDALALRVQEQARLICPVIDAKRQQVYSALFYSAGNDIRRKGTYFLGPVDVLLKKISGDVIFTGDAIRLYREQLRTGSGGRVEFAPERCWSPDPHSLAKLVYGRWKKKTFISAEKIEPLYLYKNTCTVVRKKK